MILFVIVKSPFANRFSEGDIQESPALAEPTLGMRFSTHTFAEGDEQREEHAAPEKLAYPSAGLTSVRSWK